MFELVQEVIHKTAIQCYPREACGLIVQIGQKQIAVPCKNVAQSSVNQFVLDPLDYAHASTLGTIVAVWHTHPEMSPVASDVDRMACDASGLPWFIISIVKTETEYIFSPVVSLTPSGLPVPYIGRPYFFGLFDCWSLVRDWYHQERGIELGDYPRIASWWIQGLDFFGENFKAEGFTKLIDQEPTKGDLFLMQIGKTTKPNHIGIYIGDDLMLHHSQNRLSSHEVYGGFWEKHTSHHLRHTGAPC